MHVISLLYLIDEKKEEGFKRKDVKDEILILIHEVPSQVIL